MMFGDKEVATICDLLLLAILFHQVVVYVRRYHEDRLLIKFWIWTSFALELVATGVLIWTASYSFNDREPSVNVILTSLVLTCILALLSQSFLGLQANIAATQRWHCLAGIYFLTMITFASGILCVVETRNHPSIDNIDFIATTIFLSLSAGLDTLLAAIVTYGFYKGRDSLDPIAYRVMRLLTITMNALAWIATADLIMFITSGSLTDSTLIIHAILTKFYVLAVLLPLNKRELSTSSDALQKFSKNSIDVENSRISESGYVYEAAPRPTQVPQISVPASVYISTASAYAITASPGHHHTKSTSHSLASSQSNRFSQINLEATHAGYWASLEEDDC